MCEDEGTRGGDGAAKAARCGGKGGGGLCQWFQWGKAIREMLGKAHLSLGGGMEGEEAERNRREDDGSEGVEREGDGNKGDGRESYGREGYGSEGTRSAT